MCTSKIGTNINKPANTIDPRIVGLSNVNKYFGNTPEEDDRGNCKGQIKLK
jgi:hypothetical protein